MEKRNLLGHRIIIDKSRLIQQKLFSLPEFLKAKTVMFYISFGSEVDTIEMINSALKSSKTVCVPVSDFELNEMKAVELNAFEELSPNDKGILEPSKGTASEIDSSRIDLIIVPGIAFDEKGNRLGFGAGFYDKFTANCNAKLIALAFEEQIEKEIPSLCHDQKVHKIITETKVIECK